MRKRTRWSVFAVVLAEACGSAAPSRAHPPETPAVSSPTPAPHVAPAATPSPAAAPPATAFDAALLGRLSGPRTVACTEGELPARFRSGQRVAAPDNLGRGLAIDVPRGLVTAGEVNGTRIAVYQSYALDPSSEIGDAGLRLRLVHPDGRSEDLSLGFASMRPWVVFHVPGLPLLDGDTLQLAADVRELDDESITFPPVGLRARREVDDRLLRCPLASLRADADADGLTDLEEERLATDPRAADTDGDGVGDHDDPSPLGAAAPSSTDQEVWVAAFERVVGTEMAGDLLIVQSNGPRLSLPAPRTARVLFLREAELAAYRAKFGAKVTFDMSVQVRDRDHATVDVSFGWRGERYAATRGPDGTWSFVGGMSWIS